MPLDRAATIAEVTKTWFTPCSDNVIYAYRTNQLTGESGNVHVKKEFDRLKRAGKLPGDGWQAVIIPDVDSVGNPISGLYNNERACFIRKDPTGTTIPLPGTTPAELAGTFLIVPFYKCGGRIMGDDATPDGLVDCAHFVSSCLTAGGVKISESGVSGLVDWLYRRPDTRTLGVKVTRAQGNRILNTDVMDPGDVITFFHDRGYQHSVIYTGRDETRQHRIACHTIARFHNFFWDDPWHITDNNDWRFTLIHFDKQLMSAASNPQKCEVTSAGNSEVYFFYSNGVVKRTRGDRSSHASPGARAHDHGYWFDINFDSFVIWPVTGQVVSVGVRKDLLTDISEATSITIDIDGHPGEMVPF